MLTLWDPRNDPLSLREAINRLFEHSFVPSPMGSQGGIALDVFETPEAFTVKASVPGSTKDKLSISFQDDTLTITAHLNETIAPEKSHFLMRERFSGEVSRSVALPVRINAEKASAEYNDGVLTLTLPKSDEVKPRTIKIG